MWARAGVAFPGPVAVVERSADQAGNLAGRGQCRRSLPGGSLRAEKKESQTKPFGSPPPTGRLDNASRVGRGPRASAPTHCSTRSTATSEARLEAHQGARDGEAEVAAFLKDLGLSRYTEALLRNGFDDMETLVHLEAGDMRELGMPACHVVKLRRRLQELLRRAGEGGPSGEVVAFLAGTGLGQYAERLLRVGFDDLDTLAHIEDCDLKDLGVPRGHAVKLRRRLQELQSLEAPSRGVPGRSQSDSSGGTRSASGSASTSVRRPPAPPDEMKTAVEWSWELVQARGLHSVGELFYRHTFELAPQAKDLFPPEVRHKYREWTADEGADDGSVYESPVMRKLFAKFVNAIGCTVAGLHDVSKLVPMLRALGARHTNYGVTEEHWPIVGRALMLTLKEVLGSAFSPEVESAWSTVYSFMSSIMLGGLRGALAAGEELSDRDEDAQSKESLSTRIPSRLAAASAAAHGRRASALGEDAAEEQESASP